MTKTTQMVVKRVDRIIVYSHPHSGVLPIKIFLPLIDEIFAYDIPKIIFLNHLHSPPIIENISTITIDIAGCLSIYFHHYSYLYPDDLFTRTQRGSLCVKLIRLCR